MEARTLRIEVESDGDPTPFSDDSALQVYTQLGSTDRLEVGSDVVDVDFDSQYQSTAKWLAVPESDDGPAVAIGLLDMTNSGPLSDWYVVLSKDVGEVRLHGGCLSDGAGRGMVGMEYWPTERTGLLADWMTGPEAHLAGGIYHDVGDGFGGSVYYARNNTRADGDFAGLNFCWEGAW